MRKRTPVTNTSNSGRDQLFAEISSDIARVKQDTALCDPKNFNGRADATDFIDFHIIDRIESLLPETNLVKQLSLLKERAENLKFQLEEIDKGLFARLRAGIKMGYCGGEAFKEMVMEYVGQNPGKRENQTIVGYDNSDAFINGLLLDETIPDETLNRTPEMVFYQQTPARVIFELVEKAGFKADDVFYDLGSGLGHVPILVNLLSGIKAMGVEFEPAYCNYAMATATAFNLAGIQFINIDARQADYSDGTVFFMYTPFEGRMLADVLKILRLRSEGRNIKLFTYGPCTLQIARQSWLTSEDPEEQHHVYKLGMFETKN